MLQGFTDLADQAVILPVIALFGAGLVLSGQRRAGLVWGLAMCGTLGVVLVAKLCIYACGVHLPAGWELRSPSGHTASAAAVFGGMAAFMLRWAGGGLVPAASVAMAFGASRVLLGVHTVADVLAGGVVGVVGACAFILLARPTAQSRRVVVPWLIPTGAAILLLHAHRLDAERVIGDLAFVVWPLSLCSGGFGQHAAL